MSSHEDAKMLERALGLDSSADNATTTLLNICIAQQLLIEKLQKHLNLRNPGTPLSTQRRILNGS